MNRHRPDDMHPDDRRTIGNALTLSLALLITTAAVAAVAPLDDRTAEALTGIACVIGPPVSFLASMLWTAYTRRRAARRQQERITNRALFEILNRQQ